MKTVKSYGRVVDLFRNGEHFDFHRFIVAHTSPIIAGAPGSLPLWNVFNNLFHREDIIYKRSSVSIETKYLNEANSARRNAFAVFRGKVNVAAIGLDGAERDAAVILGEILKNYKAIRTASMTETDALIVNMIQDLAKPRYAAAVQTLKLAAVVDKIEETNNSFMSLYEERARNLEDSEEQGTMKEIRPKVDKAFRSFTQSLDVTYSAGKLTGNDVEVVGDIIDYINAMIDQFERVLAHRGVSMGSKGNNSEEEDPEMPEMQIPVLAVSEQWIDNKKTMTLVMADQVAFAAALYPKAESGVMVLVANPSLDGSHTNCPIKPYFAMDGQTPIGLCVEPPEENFVFVMPLQSFGPCTAEVIKDDVVLATLADLEWPVADGE